jgi:hypothetical protein
VGLERCLDEATTMRVFYGDEALFRRAFSAASKAVVVAQARATQSERFIQAMPVAIYG